MRFLFLRRIPSRGGFWQGVTGAPLPGETNVEAAVREVREETGFDVGGSLVTLDVAYAHESPVGEVPVATFGAEVPGEAEPTLDPAEHDAYRWLAYEDAWRALDWPIEHEALRGRRQAVAALASRLRSMEQRLSLVTLGVRDLARARAFYEALGWKTGAEPDDDVVFFQAGGMIVALWGRDQLAEDSGVEDGGGWGGVTLAYNTRSPAEVDAAIEEARAAGATIVREPAEAFWGGYSGVFVDPDGHPWEVAHNPHWTVADDGSVRLGA